MVRRRTRSTTRLTGDQAAFVSRYRPLAIAMAVERCGRSSMWGREYEEMIHDAAEDALIASSRTFDPGLGYKATTHVCFRIGHELTTAMAGKLRKYRRPPVEIHRLALADPESLAWSDPRDCFDDEGFEELIKGLLPRERQVLSLIYRDGLDTYEAAEAMGCSQAYASRVKQEALSRLRYKLDASPGQELSTSPCSA